MKIPIKYHYTYFILPFVIDKNNYEGYVENILKKDFFKYKTYTKKEYPELFLNFSNDVTDSLFNSKKLNKLPHHVKVNIIKNQNLNIFEYTNKQDLVGILNKDKDENSIEFNIQNIKLFLFKNGICFLLFKTNIENKDFEDVLDFNYRFREIISELNKLQKFQSIKISESKYDSLKEFKVFIKNLIDINLEDIPKYTNMDNFYTFAYTCLENSAWNENTDPDVLTNIVQKYMKNYSSSYNTDISKIGANLQTEYEFRKIGITKTSSNLLCSGVDPYNFGYLPVEYETIYLFTYILSLFYKISLIFLNKRINNLKENDNIGFKRILNDLNYFNKNFWSIELSNSQRLTNYFNSLVEGLNLNNSYLTLISKINLIYKENKLDENITIKRNIFIILFIILLVIVLFEFFGW